MGPDEPRPRVARYTVEDHGRDKADPLNMTAVPDAPVTAIRPPAILSADGTPVMAIWRHSADLTRLRQAFIAYPMSTTKRAIGVRNISAVFGNVSRRVHMKREGCRACNGASEAPDAHAAILLTGARIAAELDTILPYRHRADTATAKVIKDTWKIPGTNWTSGVLNETSPLPYHYDRNNLETWSAMIVLRRGVTGGHLSIPQFDITLECRDGDVIAFPGWKYLHGVTPITQTKPDGYRYTAVYYTIAGMSACLDPAEETARARRERSKREDNLLDNQTESGLLT